MFSNDQQAHEHALETLGLLGSYDSFMESIDSICDLGCGNGLDLEWWATRAILDDNDNKIPLNIDCTGIDLNKRQPSIVEQYKNIKYRCDDFENIKKKKKFDVLWSHNSFQYALNPLATLKHWRELLNDNGMLAIVVPTTTEAEYNRINITQQEYCYYHHTTVSMLHMLAINGFDCAFMQKIPGDPWLKAIAYKSDIEPFNPRTTRWYHLAETELLPESARSSINRFGYLRQQDLVLEWLDRSLHWFGED